MTSELPRIVIAATNSGAGKTTVTIGIMAALQKRGLIVQGFKCGPDYIDPGYHSAVTGRTSRNLDSWFVGPDLVKQIFIKNADDADISVIEGVMGLYDGKDSLSDYGSTAEISEIINAPVILILDARSMARSAAAIVRGFQIFSQKIHIAGVIANKVGSANHLQIIRESIEKECGIPVIGGILRNEKLQVPERHLGLLPAIERGDLNSLFETLGETIEKSLDLDLLLKISGSQKVDLLASDDKVHIEKTMPEKISVAVARDAAFNFYYSENLEVMREAGMEIVYFSPLNDEAIPDGACGLYLGGGFPEEFAEALSKSQISKKSISEAIEKGMPVIGECGGFMYLTQEIVDKQNHAYIMAGVLPGRVIMKNKMAALGYREISGLKNNFLLNDGEVIRGHEFHYSVYQEPVGGPAPRPAYHMKGRNIDIESGFIHKNLVAGYAHFYFLSNPSVVERWAEKCREYKTQEGNI